MNKYNVGDTVRIRRYKDLCCEFPVVNGNIVNSGHIDYNQRRICGSTATISRVTWWYGGGSDPETSAYNLSGLNDGGFSGWTYKECYLESEVL